MDPCLELVLEARNRPAWSRWQRAIALPLRVAFLHQDTPQDRIERAVHVELSDLSRRAASAVAAQRETASVAAGPIMESLLHAEQDGSFPRHELEARIRELESGDLCRADRSLGDELEVWVARHQRFEKRLQWLLDPELTRRRMPELDPLEDADQIWCFVKYDFRPEFLYCVWGNAINRIAQSESATTFFHATGAAENFPAKRTEDTLIYYYYLLNWGHDSFHGRKALEGMNRIHGRYFIHNDGMKYVLLNAAFTCLDGFLRVAHRPLTETERLGFFHATVNMGTGMNISGLNHSWDEMYGWFHDVSRSFARHTPYKRRMWTTITDNFDMMAGVPAPVGRLRRVLEFEAMDENYRSALGVERPSRAKVALARGVIRSLARMRRLLPRGPYVESLQSFLTYPDGVDITEVGERTRSSRLPSACPFSRALSMLPNRGYPEGQIPLMDVSEAGQVDLEEITWEEVRRHNTADDLWVVFGGHVYDVSSFARNHPGGLDVLVRGVGRDQTVEFERAGHTALTKVFALNFRIGRIEARESARHAAAVASVSPDPPEAAIVLGDVHMKHAGSGVTASALSGLIRAHRGCEIILNGDTFDLSSDPFRRDPAESIATLIGGYPALRDAIRCHLASGSAITIICGNHDSRIQLPSVRIAILATLGLADHARLEIAPWFVRRQGAHIEHGHVYDPDNAPTHPLCPSTFHTEPLGVALMRRFFGPYGIHSYASVNETPPLKAFGYALREYGIRGPIFYAKLFGVFTAVCVESLLESRCTREKSLGAAELGHFGNRIGVGETTLRELLNAAPRPTHTSFSSTFMRLYMDRMLAAASIPAGALLAPIGPAAVGLVISAAAAYLAVSMACGTNRYPERIPRHLQQGASLVRSLTGARTVVFGHTHREYEEEGYINSGSFGIGNERARPFVRVDERGGIRRLAFPAA